METVIEHLSELRIIPIAVIDDPAKAVPLAKALLAGGCDIIEVSFQSDAAPTAIVNIATEVPEMCVGAGVLLSADEVSTATSAGASFGISPGFDPAVVKAAAEAGFPFISGFLTPSNVAQALSFGCEVQKFYPAEPIGPAVLQASLSTFSHKHNFKVVAAGGITPENIGRWLAVPQVLACGASWICPREMIEAEDWAGITARVRQMLAAAHQVSPPPAENVPAQN